MTAQAQAQVQAAGAQAQTHTIQSCIYYTSIGSVFRKLLSPSCVPGVLATNTV